MISFGVLFAAVYIVALVGSFAVFTSEYGDLSAGVFFGILGVGVASLMLFVFIKFLLWVSAQ